MKARAITELSRLDFDLTAMLPEDERILSPSDFGFHNTIVKPDGSFWFVDFEYAGWDDRAKLLGDLVHQIDIPIPSHFYGIIRDNLAASHPNPTLESKFLDILTPIYGLKWIAIILNPFTQLGMERISRSNPENFETYKVVHFQRAREKFSTLSETLNK